MMKNLFASMAIIAAACASTAASATVYYVSDCQASASSGCVAGSDSNSGTSPAAAWRTAAKLRDAFNAAQPGDQILLAKGGAWSAVAVTLQNVYSATSATNLANMIANPVVIDSYTPSWGAGTAKPILQGTTTTGDTVFSFTAGSSGAKAGGYVLRNLSFKAPGYFQTAAINFFRWPRNVVLDNLTVDGFGGAGITCGGQSAYAYPDQITIRNSTFKNIGKVAVGSWGCSNVLIEKNTFDNNGFDDGTFGQPIAMNHALYVSGTDANDGSVTKGVIIRGNTLTNNSVCPASGQSGYSGTCAAAGQVGRCSAAVIVGHDVASDWVIENNLIYQAAGTAYPTCWGIALSPGNGGYLEGMDRLVIRSNTIVNVGNNGIEVAACRTCTIENNVVIWEGTTEAIGIRYHAAKTTPAYTGTALTVRNNSVYFARTSDVSRGIVVDDQGTNHTVVSNLVYFGTGSVAAACFDSNLAPGAFAAWNNNLCFGGGWTGNYATRSALTTATGFDVGGVSVDPKLAAMPTLTNNFSMALSSNSPAINTGSLTLSSVRDRLSVLRNVPDIGAFEWNSTVADTVAPAAPPAVAVR